MLPSLFMRLRPLDLEDAFTAFLLAFAPTTATGSSTACCHLPSILDIPARRSFPPPPSHFRLLRLYLGECANGWMNAWIAKWTKKGEN